MGRPSVYTPEIADEICNRLAAGETLKEICRSDYMPDERTVRTWALEDRNGFSPRYTRARDLQVERWADELLEISDDARNDWMERNEEIVANHEHIQRSKLRSDNRKWLLSKLKPERYGDRLEMTGANGSPLIPARTDDPDRIAQAVILMMQAPTARLARARVIEHSEPKDSDGANDAAE